MTTIPTGNVSPTISPFASETRVVGLAWQAGMAHAPSRGSVRRILLSTTAIGCVSAALLLGAGTHEVAAQSATWTGATESYGTATNWTDNTVPVIGGIASFAGAGSKTVDLGGSPFAPAEVQVTGGNYTFQNGSFENTTLVLGNGTTTQFGAIGADRAATTVTSSDSIFAVRHSGTLTLINTGTISSPGPDVFNGGDNGTGNLTLLNSGTISSSVLVGVNTSGSGTVTNAAGGILRGGSNSTFGNGVNIFKTATIDNYGSILGGATGNNAALQVGAGSTVNLHAGSTTTSIRLDANSTLSLYNGTGPGAAEVVDLSGIVLQNAGTNAAASVGAFLFTAAGTNTINLRGNGGGTDANGTTGSVTSAISGPVALTKLDSGTWTLSGANTYTGATTVSAGILDIQNAGALGGTVGGTTVSAGATLQLQGGIAVGAETLSLSGTGAGGNGALRNLSGSNSHAGAITLAAATKIQSDAGSLILSGSIGGTGQNLTLDGAAGGTISGAIATGAGTLTKTGSGSWTLAGANTFSGATTIGAGTLAVQGGSALSDTAAVTIADAAGAQLAVRASETIGSLAGGGTTGGTVEINAVQTLTSGGNNTSTTFAGTLSGAGSLAKTGTGTLTLTGANSMADSFSGNLIVGGGALRVNGTFGDLDATGGLNQALVTVNAGGTLGGSGTIAGSVAVGGGTLSAGNSPGTLAVAGNVTLGAASTSLFELGAAGVVGGAANDLVTVGGNLAVNNGTLNLQTTGGTAVASGYYTLFQTAGTTTGAFGTVNNGGAAATNATQIITNSGAAPSAFNVLVANGGQNLQFFDGANQNANGNVDGGTAIWNGTSSNWTTVDGAINDQWRSSVGIFGGTAGTVTVDGTQSFEALQFRTTGYQVTGGGLTALADSGLAGSTSASLTTDSGVTATIAGPIGGTAGLTKFGAGTLVLSGTNAYAGATAITGGTLALAGGAAIVDGDVAGDGAAGSVVVASDAVLRVDTAETIASLSGVAGSAVSLSGTLTTGDAGSDTFAGAISGAGGLTKQGTGVLTLAGANSYTGTTTVAAGTLQIAATGSLVSGVVNNGTLFQNAGTVSGALSSTTAAGNTGTISGTVTNGGTFFNSGSLSGGLSNSGTFTQTAGSVSRGTTNTGTVAANGGTFGGAIANTAGSFTVGGTVTANAGFSNTGTATLSVATGSLTGITTLSNASTAAIGVGVAAGTTLSAGSVTNAAGSTIANNGTLASTAGLSNAGTLVNASGAVLSGGLTNSGTASNAGTLSGGLSNAAGASYAQSSGITAGGATNAGTVAVSGGAVNGAITNSAGSFSVTGAASSDDGFTNAGAATLAISGTGAYSVAGLLANDGTATVAAGGSLTVNGGLLSRGGTITSAGRIEAPLFITGGAVVSTGSVIGDVPISAGTLATSGSLAGNLAATGGTVNASGTLAGSISNAGTADVNVVGDLAGVTTVSNAGTATFDVIGGNLTGVTTLTNMSSASAGVSVAAGRSLSVGTLAGTNAASAINVAGTLGFANATYSGLFTGAGTVNQDGGAFASGASNTATQSFSGTYNLRGGTLAVDTTFGDLDATGGLNQARVVVGTGTAGSGTLQGTGTIAGSAMIAAGGTLSAGESPGTLTIAGALALDAGSTSRFQLGTPGVTNGLVDVGSNLQLGGTLSLAGSNGGPAAVSGVYRLFNYGGTVSGGYAAVESGAASSLVYTSVPQQVNLRLSNGGQLVQFWDGPDQTGTVSGVQGGSGTWSTAGTNWTDALGTSSSDAWRSQVGVFGATGGTVTITGAQSAQGLQFTTNGYRLVAGTGGSLQLAADVVSPGFGFVNTDGGITAEIAASISGVGLRKLGAGTLILSGINTYTGGTQVAAGTLSGSSASIKGPIANAGTVVLNETANATLAGAVSGLGGTNGQMIKQGAGQLTLAGASTLDWTVAGGGLTTTSDNFTGNLALATGTNVTFDQTGDGTYAGVLSGSGVVLATGAGRVNLTGNSAGFGGTTTVNGTLAVNGVVGGNLDVISDGRLSGAGTVGGNVTLASGATIAPGNSPGTLTIGGNLAFAPGSTYEVETVANSTLSDRIDVGGSASLAGSLVHVGLDGAYQPTQTYTVLSAQGGISGQFDSVSSRLLFLSPLLAYDTTTVRLTLNRNDIRFAQVAATANQRAAASGLEGLSFSNAAYSAATLLDAGSARLAFDQLSGEVHASQKTGRLEDSRVVRNTAMERLDFAFSDRGSTGDVALGDTGLSAWISGYGSWGEVAGDGNAAALDRDLGGFLVGADGFVTERLRIGMLAGYSEAFYDTAGRGSAEVNTTSIGLYAGTEMGGVILKAGASYGFSDIATARQVAYGTFSDSLNADYDGHTAQVFGEAAYRFVVAPATTVTPFANLAYVSLGTDGFAERGGASSLHSAGDTVDATFSTLGLRSSAAFSLGDVALSANAMLGWRHAFGDTTASETLSFVLGSAFNVSGVSLVEDAAVLELGLDLVLAPNASLGLAYSGVLGDGFHDNGVKARFEVKF